MQEKTLEQLFEEYGHLYMSMPYHEVSKEAKKKMKEITNKIEEKAREEGRKEAIQQKSELLYPNEIIAQYKEELLGKIRLNCALYDSKDTNEVDIPVIRYTTLKDIIEG